MKEVRNWQGEESGKGEIGLPKLVLLGVTQRTFSKNRKASQEVGESCVWQIV